MAVAPGVGQPFQQQQTGALPPARAVGRVREGLAAAVRRESALPGELHEDRGGGHHGGAARQSQFALAVAERLRGQVQRDEGRGAGRVDGQGGALEPERVGDPTGRHAGGAAVADVALVLGGGAQQQSAAVVAVHDPGEDARGRAAEPVGGDARALQGLPAQFQQQPLLRVHGGRLAR